MKKTVMLAAFLVLGMLGAVQAQTNLKIGYMNVDFVLSQLPESKQIETELKAYNDQLQNSIQTKYKDFETKLKDYQEKPPTNEVIRKDKEKELQNLQTSIQELQQSAEKSLRERQQKALTPVLDKIQKAIDEVAKENGFTYVFNSDAGLGTSPILLHAPEESNVNTLVLKKLGVTAPAAAAQGTTKPTGAPAQGTKPANPAPKK